MNFDLYFTQLTSTTLMKSSPTLIAAMVKEIIACEATHGSWTLMHRFNKCGEFLNRLDVKSELDVYPFHIMLGLTIERGCSCG